MKAYTDYPFVFLGDKSGREAPIREVEILAYDENKYVMIDVEGCITSVKSGYLYNEPERLTIGYSPSKVNLNGVPGRQDYYRILDEKFKEIS